MRLKISHQTDYVYDQPVPYGLQELRMTPRTGPGQTILSWDLSIEGGQIEAEFDDQHGNRVHLLGFEHGLETISLTCTGEVETLDLAGIFGAHRGFAPLWYFNRITDLTQPGEQIRDLAESISRDDDNPVRRLHALSATIASQVRYETGRTHSETTAEDALIAGVGVCQDHTHVFLSAARLMGHPARYVSGYLLMEGVDVQTAGHAWAEAYVADLGWVGFDASNGISPDERYVRLATGLDSHEAAPISGMRYGAGSESMAVTLMVQQQ